MIKKLTESILVGILSFLIFGGIVYLFQYYSIFNLLIPTPQRAIADIRYVYLAISVFVGLFISVPTFIWNLRGKI